MDYYYKYQKYKKKYLELSNSLVQKGGNKLTIYDIKDINLFEENSKEEKYLNPIYGCIWSQNANDYYYNINN